MIAILIAALLFAVAAVLALMRSHQIVWRSTDSAILGGVAAIIFLTGCASYPVAHHIAQRGAIGGFHQFLNGSIVEVPPVDTTTCHRDGSCKHEYDCDPYEVKVVDREAYTDKDGNYHAEQSHEETRYHDCPYSTKEYTYKLKDNFDNTYTLGDHVFAADPKAWRDGKSLPSNVFRGVPEQWSKAKANLEAGNADPVTVPDTYDNFILADEHTLLRAYSDDIDSLKEAKLLPEHTASLKDPIHDYYMADKVSFVGMSSDDNDAWQSTLMHFNAALGMEHQGDMHVVIVKASAIPSSVSPQDYANAVKAYWLNDLGKYALAKNGIMLILAVDDTGSIVEWSKADTGMPIGNGAMLQALSTQLDGQPLSPDILFGDTTAQVKDSKVSYTIGAGLVSDIVMNRFPFKRACMACEDKEDEGTGFVSLSVDIPLGTGGTIWTIIIDLLLAALLTVGGFFLLDTSTVGEPRLRRSYRNSY